jgi:hypothetical protein
MTIGYKCMAVENGRGPIIFLKKEIIILTIIRIYGNVTESRLSQEILGDTQ